VLRCGNAGWSGWIDEFGVIRGVMADERAASICGGEEPAVRRDIRWIGRRSFYVEHGDWFVVVCAGLVALAISRCGLALRSRFLSGGCRVARAASGTVVNGGCRSLLAHSTEAQPDHADERRFSDDMAITEWCVGRRLPPGRSSLGKQPADKRRPTFNCMSPAQGPRVEGQAIL